MSEESIDLDDLEELEPTDLWEVDVTHDWVDEGYYE